MLGHYHEYLPKQLCKTSLMSYCRRVLRARTRYCKLRLFEDMHNFVDQTFQTFSWLCSSQFLLAPSWEQNKCILFRFFTSFQRLQVPAIMQHISQSLTRSSSSWSASKPLNCSNVISAMFDESVVFRIHLDTQTVERVSSYSGVACNPLCALVLWSLDIEKLLVT